MSYQPPFEITPAILELNSQVYRLLGAISGAKLDVPPIELRRLSNIHTIQASLAIEGNTLGLDQVTTLFNGKRVIGPKKDILEVESV